MQAGLVPHDGCSKKGGAEAPPFSIRNVAKDQNSNFISTPYVLGAARNAQ